MVAVQQLDLWDYHTHPDRYQARLQVIKLYYQGWDKVVSASFYGCHARRWIGGSRVLRANIFAGLMDHKRGPKAPWEAVVSRHG